MVISQTEKKSDPVMSIQDQMRSMEDNIVKSSNSLYREIINHEETVSRNLIEENKK